MWDGRTRIGFNINNLHGKRCQKIGGSVKAPRNVVEVQGKQEVEREGKRHFQDQFIFAKGRWDYSIKKETVKMS